MWRKQKKRRQQDSNEPVVRFKRDEIRSGDLPRRKLEQLEPSGRYTYFFVRWRCATCMPHASANDSMC